MKATEYVYAYLASLDLGNYALEVERSSERETIAASWFIFVGVLSAPEPLVC